MKTVWKNKEDTIRLVLQDDLVQAYILQDETWSPWGEKAIIHTDSETIDPYDYDLEDLIHTAELQQMG